MVRIKLTLLFGVVSMQALLSPSFAEQPQNLDEIVFALSGSADYLQWVKSSGVVRFCTPIGCFNEAEFFSCRERPEWDSTHCRIRMHSVFDGSQGLSNAVSAIKSVENILLKELRIKDKRFNCNESMTNYFSVCTNIDNCGWTATFTVQYNHNNQGSAQSLKVIAEFQKDLSMTNTCEEILEACRNAHF